MPDQAHASFSFCICIWAWAHVPLVYNWGAISRSQGSKTPFPPGSDRRKKSLFKVIGFRGLFVASSGPQRRLLGSLYETSWDPFCGPRWWVGAASETVWPWTVLRCESQRASIAKISKPYSTSFENRWWARAAVHLLTRGQTAIILPSKSCFCGLYPDHTNHVFLL